MKLRINVLFISVIVMCSVLVLSCSKEESLEFPVSAGLLQNKWILDSILVYDDADLTGPAFKGYDGDDTNYFDFRRDGKVYVYAGIPTPEYDTAAYTTINDTTTLLTYDIVNGIQLPVADTSTIYNLSSTSLILITKNEIDEYEAFYFKR